MLLRTASLQMRQRLLLALAHRAWQSSAATASDISAAYHAHSLGADPAQVPAARAAARRVLSGAYSRETLLLSSSRHDDGGADTVSSRRQFSAHEMQLAASCCIYGQQKWHSLTLIGTGGVSGVELLTEPFQPPGSGQMVLLGAGDSVHLPQGRPYYICGRGHAQSRLLLVSVPPLDGSELQDADGSYPAPG